MNTETNIDTINEIECGQSNPLNNLNSLEEYIMPFILPNEDMHPSYKKKRPRSLSPSRHHKRHKRNIDHEPYLDSDSDSDDGHGLFGHRPVNVYADKNHIYFRTAVNQNSVDKLIELIDEKNVEYMKLKKNKLIKSCSPAPLYLHITSYGGSILYGFKAIDAILNSELPIYTIVDGYAASAGTMMSVCGVKRYMTKHGYMLIHEITYGFGGKFKELKDGMANAKRWMEDIENLYLKRTKLTKSDLEKYMKHDYWWNFEKCQKLGLIDDLWEGNLST